MTTAGYGILLEAALRPLLLVFSLIIAWTLLAPVVDLTYHSFVLMASVVNSEFSPFMFLIVGVAQAILFVAVIMIMFDKVLDIIDTLPSIVLRWINIHAGGERGDLDQHVSQVFGAFKSEVRSVSQTGVGAMKKPPGTGGKGAGKGADQIDDKNL